MIVASGAQYRPLSLDRLSEFVGAGVYYAATGMEAQVCDGEEVIIVGGGNSAGQAAVFLSGSARHVHVLVRSDGLAASMSRYLIRRIEENPRITLHTRTEIEALEGDRHLEARALALRGDGRGRDPADPARLPDDGRRSRTPCGYTAAWRWTTAHSSRPART